MKLHTGCKKKYTNTDVDNQVCVYHPGQVTYIFNITNKTIKL